MQKIGGRASSDLSIPGSPGSQPSRPDVGRIFTDLAPMMPEKTLEILGLLLDDLAAARALR